MFGCLVGTLKIRNLQTVHKLVAAVVQTRARKIWAAMGALATFFSVWPESRNFLLDIVRESHPTYTHWGVGIATATCVGFATHYATQLINTRRAEKSCQNFHRLAHGTRNAKLRLNDITDLEVDRLKNTEFQNWKEAHDAYHLTIKRAAARQSRACLDLLVQHLNKVHSKTTHRAHLQLVYETGGQQTEQDIRTVNVHELCAAVFVADAYTTNHVSEKYPDGEQCTSRLIDKDSALMALCKSNITHHFASNLVSSDDNSYCTLTSDYEKEF